MPHIGYKTLLTKDGKLCCAILKIPDDALTNEGRTGVKVREKANFRCSKATVLYIYDLDGNQIADAYSQYHQKIKYTIGQTVESNFDRDVNKVCASGIYYFLSQVIYVMDPKKSKYTGTYIGYDETGEIMRERNYVDGILHGRCVSYNEDGKIEEEENYVDGKREGRYVEYYESGQIMCEANYVDGKLDGRCVWYYKSGKIEEEGNYIDGKIDGRSIAYYKSGQIRAEGTYVDGKLHGRRVNYYKSGKIKKESNYVDGEIVE